MMMAYNNRTRRNSSRSALLLASLASWASLSCRSCEGFFAAPTPKALECKGDAQLWRRRTHQHEDIRRRNFEPTVISKRSLRMEKEHFSESSTLKIGSKTIINRRGMFEKSVVGATAAATGSGALVGKSRIANAMSDGENLMLLPPSLSSPSSSTILSSSTETTTVPTITLGKSELEITRTIQGYWQLAGGHGKYKPEDAIKNMQEHFKAGITTLDTADIYGPSELIVGNFVKTQPQAVPCTKFCCFRFLDEIDKNEVKTRIQKSCQRLGVDTSPLVQFFWGNYDVKRYVDVALMLTELKEEGLIREIGATNFDLKRLKELKNAGVPLVSHQVQMSALDQRAVQSGQAEWCAANDIKLIAFGTVASGILSEKYLGRSAPPTQEEKNTASMRMYSNTAARFGDWKLVQELLQTMNSIATEVRGDGRCPEASIANIAQRYVLDTVGVGSVLIGVRNTNHIDENVRTHSFQMTDAERSAIDSVIAKRRGPKGDIWDIERGYI